MIDYEDIAKTILKVRMIEDEVSGFCPFCGHPVDANMGGVSCNSCFPRVLDVAAIIPPISWGGD